MTTESKRLKAEAKKLGIPVQSYALATLMAAGWTAAEAYALAYYENASFGASQNAQIRDNIVLNPNFTDIIEKIRDGFPTRNVLAAGANDGRLPSKDDIAQIIATEMYSLTGKERVEAAMKLADLFAMKKEEIKDDGDEKIIHVFLPIPDSELEILVEKKARELLRQQSEQQKEKGENV